MKQIYKVFALIVFVVLSACSSPTPIATATPAATKTLRPPTATPNTTFKITFAQRFTPTKCPDGSPAGAFCLNVSGTAIDPVLGEISMTRVAVLEFLGKKDENQCVPASTNGKLLIGGDEVAFTASGVFCSKTSVATYNYTITGGTGQYAKASGSGVIDVPAPANTNVVEVWSGTLVK